MSVKKTRVGRGNSSKKGNTCGRGNKGQKSRSGYSKRRFFSGGQTPINIRYPKVGFKRSYKIKYIKFLNSFIYINNFSSCKLLLSSYLKKKSFLYGFIASKSSIKKIEFLGGNAV
ncbi:50S ribosomal protein L15 [Candidatus Vidania fulgoroideorum]